MRDRVRRVGAALAATFVGLALVTAGAPAAFADDPVATVTFDPPTSQSVSYGNYWVFPFTGANALSIVGPWTTSATCSGCPGGYQPSAYVYQTDANTVAGGVADNGNPLLPGTYSFTATITSPYSSSGGTSTSFSTTTPAQLTITKAALGVAAHVSSDAANPRNAIVSAQFTGDFIDQSSGGEGPDLSGLIPAGTWKVSIVDAGGTVVQSFTSDRKTDNHNVAVSFSWPDVAPGNYKATATFAPSGAAASNFAFAASAPVTFTAPGAAPGDASTASPAPTEQPATSDTQSGPEVPVWLLLAVGLVTLAFLALVIFQIVQLARLRVVPPGPAGVSGEGAR